MSDDEAPEQSSSTAGTQPPAQDNSLRNLVIGLLAGSAVVIVAMFLLQNAGG